jgi:hypothetical protein
VPFLDITIGNADAARSDLRAVPALVDKMSQAAVTAVANATKGEASRLTRQKYAIGESDLDPFIRVSKLGNTPQGGASVTLLARPLPLSVFRPTVKMQTYTLKSRAGRTYTRKLPTVWVKRFARGSAKQLKPYFPLHQRRNGLLAAGDRAARRVGNTKVGRDGYEGNKLTGVRFYTFPKTFLQTIRPQLVDFVGARGSLELREAFRKNFKGMRVLRGPR